MTLDDLAKAFENACYAYNEAHPECTPDDLERVGIRAVVLALRGVICDNVYMTQECCGMGVPSRNGMHEECCGNPVHSITRDNLIMSFNNILGDAVEKATGGHEEEGVGPEYARQRFGTPAAAPSPAVCEWTHEHGPYWLRHCHELGPEILAPDIDLGVEGMPCGLCRRPIKFKVT